MIANKIVENKEKDLNIKLRQILSKSSVLNKIRKKEYNEELESLIEQHKFQTQSTDSSQEILITKKDEKDNFNDLDNLINHKNNIQNYLPNNYTNHLRSLKLSKMENENEIEIGAEKENEKEKEKEKEAELKFTFNLPKENNNIVKNIGNSNSNYNNNNMNFNNNNNYFEKNFLSPKSHYEISTENNNSNKQKTAGFNYMNKNLINSNSNSNSNTNTYDKNNGYLIQKDLPIFNDNENSNNNNINNNYNHRDYLNFIEKKRNENRKEERRNSIKNILDAFSNVSFCINKDKEKDRDREKDLNSMQIIPEENKIFDKENFIDKFVNNNKNGFNSNNNTNNNMSNFNKNFGKLN
jgi:hypothetical protein